MTDQELIQRAERELDHSPDMSRKTVLLLIAIALLCILALTWHNRAEADSLTLSWTAPTQNTDGTPLTNLAGYRIVYGPSATSLSQTIQVSNAAITTYMVENLTAGKWYFSVKAYNSTGAESGLSNIASKTIAAEPPPPPPPPPPVTKTLKVIDPAVYNTGTFNTTAWLVKRNKLYGTVALGTPCDASKPASDGYWRVPVASVRWTNTKARTPYPLARCALQ